MSLIRSSVAAAACALLGLVAVCSVSAQTKRGTGTTAVKPSGAKAAPSVGPKITVLDLEGFKKLLKPASSKPLMINFWATWCDPCVAEFPDLVKIDQLYKGKIDFVTVSLDDLADIETEVPKFLTKMKAGMPAYLLHADNDAAIAAVSADWAGNLPLTIIYKPSGELVYMRKGAIHIDDVTLELDKLVRTQNKAAAPASQQ